METRDIGRLFVLPGNLFEPKGKGLVFCQRTFELDPPYRYANTLVFRLPRGRGVMLGWWRKSPAGSLQQHFEAALAIREVRDSRYAHQDTGPQHAKKIKTVTWAEMSLDERREARSKLSLQWPGTVNMIDEVGVVRDDEAF